MKTKICEICGCEFSTMTLGQKYCRDCHEELYRSIKPEQHKRNPNQRLIDDVKEATKQGLSYGRYKGRGCIRYAAMNDIPIPNKYSYMRKVIGV